MSALSRPAGPSDVPRVVVLGDLVVDVVLLPTRPLVSGTDVPGRISLRQGGSAATTARWLGKLGIHSTLVCAVGRDGAGRALVARVASDGVHVAATRVAGVRTGRIGVVVEPGGERSFVADRGAADRLRPDDLKDSWFERVDLVHLPVYSLLAQPLGEAARAAVSRARGAQARVSIDLASIGPLLANGVRAARLLVREVTPDLVLATAAEAQALVGGRVEGLTEIAPIAVVKRGPRGATILAREDDGILRFEVATKPLPATDTTGAGDAFDAGFIAAWLDADRRGMPLPAALQRAAVAGHRAAARHMASAPAELPPG